MVKKIIKSTGYGMLIIISLLLITIVIAAGFILLRSNSNPTPLRDERGEMIAGSLSEKVFIDINGYRMGMVIKSKDINNPVLLYLHGGMPTYFLDASYPTALEDYFTVVWWDQRGCGLSYGKIEGSSIPSELMISDTEEISKYLISRFGKEKIYLMGHSGGSFLGIKTASAHPELYHAYIGVAQISNQLESERLSLEYMIQKYKELGNTKMYETLSKATISKESGISYEYLKIRDKAMHSIGVGTTRDMTSVVTGLFLPSLLNREFTIKEKINLWRGKSQSGVSWMWNEVVTTDLSKECLKFEIPIYFFHGVYDQTVSYKLAKGYFDLIEAPRKAFFTFENSAHSPVFEEPQKVKEILSHSVIQ